MTIVDDIVTQLRRGECSEKRRHTEPCATCDVVDERIAHVRALVKVARLVERGELALAVESLPKDIG